MSTQLGIFEEAGVEVTQPEPSTAVRLGTRERHVNLAKKRREALKEFMDVLGRRPETRPHDGRKSHVWR